MSDFSRLEAALIDLAQHCTDHGMVKEVEMALDAIHVFQIELATYRAKATGRLGATALAPKMH